MALAKKCDRCGEMYEVKPMSIKNQSVNGIMLIERSRDNNGYTNRGYIDLCPNCLKSFDFWIKRKFETSSLIEGND